MGDAHGSRHPRVVTANTESQLRTKTWAELAKWFRLCPLLTEFFVLTATTLAARDPAHAKTWRIDAVPWTENRVEAFAGLHNQGRRILVVFDEASAIPDLIWETTEGALTDEQTEILWLVCGNPTRNNGRFRECFGRYRHRWIRRQVDSRNARLTNKQQIAQWVTDYGEDFGLRPGSGQRRVSACELDAVYCERHGGGRHDTRGNGDLVRPLCYGRGRSAVWG